ncbi:putative integral membrane protein conserved region-domain-containing protein, partial [Thamnocephalis sphaerospora]
MQKQAEQVQQEHPEIDTFFTVLKYDTLFLYDSDEQLACRGVILTSLHDVSIHPSNLPDNEVFFKDVPIRLTRRDTEHDDVLDEESARDYYLFINSPVEKEDWYFALLKSEMAQPLEEPSPPLPPHVVSTLNFDPETMRRLIGQVYTDADKDNSMPWLNALVGRLFLAVYKTDLLREHIIHKIIKKTTRLRKPGFIDDIKVRDLYVGEQSPHIWDPHLLELSPDGTLRIALRIRYNGGFRVEIETGAVLSVTSHMRPIRVPVLLSAEVRHFEGRMLLKIKPPPSNRLWIGFFDMPDMDLVVEPVVSAKSLKYPMITQAIQSRIRDMMRETVVLPNMDDIPFFPSGGSGGIF